MASPTPPLAQPVVLTDAQIEEGRRETFSTDNPYCPCDSKTMRKAVRWAERALAALVQPPEAPVAVEVSRLADMAKDALNAAYRHGRAHQTVREDHAHGFANARHDEFLSALATMAPTPAPQVPSEAAHLVGGEAAQRMLPWDDCKVAFGCDDEDALWLADKHGKLKLPHGWKLDGTDGAGARSVVIFRVEGGVWPEDGDRVKSALRRIGAIAPKSPLAATQAATTDAAGERATAKG